MKYINIILLVFILSACNNKNTAYNDGFKSAENYYILNEFGSLIVYDTNLNTRINIYFEHKDSTYERIQFLHGFEAYINENKEDETYSSALNLLEWYRKLDLSEYNEPSVHALSDLVHDDSATVCPPLVR